MIRDDIDLLYERLEEGVAIAQSVAMLARAARPAETAHLLTALAQPLADAQTLRRSLARDYARWRLFRDGGFAVSD